MVVGMNMRGVTLDSVHTEQLRQRLLDAAKTIPGVAHAAFTVALPFWSSWSERLFVQGIDTVEKLGQFGLNAVSPDYFATFGTRIVRGRGITDRDTRVAPRVAVVSAGMAKVLWPGRDAIGQCIRLNADTMPCTTVVGIAEDIRQRNLSGDSASYMYYLPATQIASQPDIMVRVSGAASRFSDVVRRRLQREMPGASYVTVTPFREVIGSVTRSWEMGATLFVAFGGLALALAAIGLYSVIAYSVTQRTHEMGVRVALGAQVGDVVRLVVSDGVKIGAAGLAIGALAALAAARWVKPLLFNESPNDPLVFAFVTVALLAVTVAASWIPAR